MGKKTTERIFQSINRQRSGNFKDEVNFMKKKEQELAWLCGYGDSTETGQNNKCFRITNEIYKK